MTMDAGDGHTYYDISLVDGYNLPMAMVLQTNNNQQLSSIPHYLTNPSCVGSVGDMQPPGYNPYSGGQTFLNTDAQNPLPFNNMTTLSQVAQWCPYNLQVSSSTGPNGGVYIYPDGSINRPEFDPCYSACSKWNLPQDCCTGQYNSPSACKPSQYSQNAKGVCPDAYSYGVEDPVFTLNSC
jgi:beta-mannosidase